VALSRLTMHKWKVKVVVWLPCSSNSPKLNDSQSHRKQGHSLSQSKPAIYLVSINTRVILCGKKRRPTRINCWLTSNIYEKRQLNYPLECTCANFAELLRTCSWYALYSGVVAWIHKRIGKRNYNLMNIHHTQHILSFSITSITQKLGHSSNKSFRWILLLS
jgi:hypothetical protein